MIDVIEGKGFLFTFPLSTEEKLVTLNPETDSASYSLYDSKGQIVNEKENVTIEISAENPSVLEIFLDGDLNSIEDGKPYSIRFVELSYTKDTVQTTVRRLYRVIKFASYTVTESDVRDVFGLSDSVIPNSMIDLYASYVTEKSKIPNLDDKLNDFGEGAIKANRAIILRSAIRLETALALIVPRIETDNTVSQTRFTMTLDDFKKLLDDLKEELNELEDELLEEPDFVPEIPFVVGSVRDVFTGEE